MCDYGLQVVRATHGKCGRATGSALILAYKMRAQDPENFCKIISTSIEEES